MFWQLYWKVGGVKWFCAWFVYWSGLMMFRGSREKPEVYVPGFFLGAVLLAIANALWFIVCGAYLFG